MTIAARAGKAMEPALAPLAGVALALVAAGMVVALLGENPVAATRTIVAGALGGAEGIGFTLFYATNFIFTGLAVALPFRAGLFNIGVEGQATLAGVGVALAALAAGPLPAALALPLIALAGAGLGGFWAAIPGWLQARRGSHVVITTIMFNFIASALLGWLLVDPLRAPGSMQPESRGFPPSAAMPKIDDVLTLLGLPTTGSPLNASLLVALLAAICIHIFVNRTRSGFEIRLLGANPDAAACAGVSATRVVVLVMALAGALAAGVALNELTGAQNRLILEFTGGYGFVGIAVALTGRNHPGGIVLAGILFGALYQGGAELAFERPKISRDVIILVQGVVVLAIGCFGARFALRSRPEAA